MPWIRGLRLQNGYAVIDPQSFDRRSIAGKERYDDIPILCHKRAINEDAVAIEDAGPVHRVSGNAVEHSGFGIPNQPFLKIATLLGEVVGPMWRPGREVPRKSRNASRARQRAFVQGGWQAHHDRFFTAEAA